MCRVVTYSMISSEIGIPQRLVYIHVLYGRVDSGFASITSRALKYATISCIWYWPWVGLLVYALMIRPLDVVLCRYIACCPRLHTTLPHVHVPTFNTHVSDPHDHLLLPPARQDCKQIMSTAVPDVPSGTTAMAFPSACAFPYGLAPSQHMQFWIAASMHDMNTWIEPYISQHKCRALFFYPEQPHRLEARSSTMNSRLLTTTVCYSRCIQI